jgi:hypothetical protein
VDLDGKYCGLSLDELDELVGVLYISDFGPPNLAISMSGTGDGSMLMSKDEDTLIFVQGELEGQMKGYVNKGSGNLAVVYNPWRYSSDTDSWAFQENQTDLRCARDEIFFWPDIPTFLDTCLKNAEVREKLDLGLRKKLTVLMF